MVPDPVPPLVRVRVYCWTAKLVVTPVFVFIVKAHCPVPVQPPPDQPVNVEPEVGAAVSVTMLPAL